MTDYDLAGLLVAICTAGFLIVIEIRERRARRRFEAQREATLAHIAVALPSTATEEMRAVFTASLAFAQVREFRRGIEAKA